MLIALIITLIRIRDHIAARSIVAVVVLAWVITVFTV